MTNENSIKGPEIQENVIIEDALQTVSKSGSNGAIVVKDGKKIGTVSLTDMIMAIAVLPKTLIAILSIGSFCLI